MNKIRAVITAVGGYVPEYRLTNEEVATMVNTSDEWITKRIGIKERRILKSEEGKGITYLAMKAIDDLKSRCSFDPLKIDAVFFATATPDYLFPNSASLVAHKTGMINAFGFDMEAACSGFIYALEIAQSCIVSGKHRKIMVIAGDVLSTLIDYTDRNTSPIFGDGCGCALVESTTDDLGLIDSIMRCDGSIPESLHVYGGGAVNPTTHETVNNKLHYIWQDGKVVFRHAVSNMSNTCQKLIKKNNLSEKEIDWIVPHQANLRIIDAVVNSLGVSREKVMINIEKYGNTGSASIPLCLWEWESRLHKGDKLILTAFGAGFTWGATYLKWGYN
jgi:3-oxoacyl-[acyl-carrier-protein] synthase-3